MSDILLNNFLCFTCGVLTTITTTWIFLRTKYKVNLRGAKNMINFASKLTLEEVKDICRRKIEKS